jgi:hypothetical protein
VLFDCILFLNIREDFTREINHPFSFDRLSAESRFECRALTETAKKIFEAAKNLVSDT